VRLSTLRRCVMPRCGRSTGIMRFFGSHARENARCHAQGGRRAVAWARPQQSVACKFRERCGVRIECHGRRAQSEDPVQVGWRDLERQLPVPVIPPIPLVRYYGGPASEKSLIKIRLRQKIKDMLDSQDKRWNKRSYSIDSANKRSRKLTATHANNQITKALASLSPREEMLLRMRFGIGSEVEGTLSQLSRRFSLPPQRLGRIQSNAFSKLRQGSRFLPSN
jgi:hypothetical protein